MAVEEATDAAGAAKPRARNDVLADLAVLCPIFSIDKGGNTQLCGAIKDIHEHFKPGAKLQNS